MRFILREAHIFQNTIWKIMNLAEDAICHTKRREYHGA